MVTETDQVKALQKAILDRAHQLSDEHIQQGKMTRNKIMQDTREKIKLMEPETPGVTTPSTIPRISMIPPYIPVKP